MLYGVNDLFPQMEVPFEAWTVDDVIWGNVFQKIPQKWASQAMSSQTPKKMQ